LLIVSVLTVWISSLSFLNSILASSTCISSLFELLNSVNNSSTKLLDTFSSLIKFFKPSDAVVNKLVNWTLLKSSEIFLG